jgi:hypothetical protein
VQLSICIHIREATLVKVTVQYSGNLQRWEFQRKKYQNVLFFLNATIRAIKYVKDIHFVLLFAVSYEFLFCKALRSLQHFKIITSVDMFTLQLGQNI